MLSRVVARLHRRDATTARGIDGDGIRHRRTALPITRARGNRGSVAGQVRDVTLSHSTESQRFVHVDPAQRPRLPV